MNYTPLDLPDNFTIAAALAPDAETSSPAFARPTIALLISAKTSAGRALDPTGIPLQVTMTPNRQADPDTFTWIDTTADADTGLHSFLLPEGLDAAAYWIGWRVVEGDETQGDWISTPYRVY